MEKKSIPKKNEQSAEKTKQGTEKSSQVSEAVLELAEKKPEKLFELMAMEQTIVGNPIHHKMGKEHISKVLELASNHDERQFTLHEKAQQYNYDERKSIRRYAFGAFIVLVALVLLCHLAAPGWR